MKLIFIPELVGQNVYDGKSGQVPLKATINRCYSVRNIRTNWNTWVACKYANETSYAMPSTVN